MDHAPPVVKAALESILKGPSTMPYDPLEEFADWCERHLETRHNREVGMTFGDVLQTYRRLNANGRHDDAAVDKEANRLLDERADDLLMDFCTRFMIAYAFSGRQPKPLYPSSLITSMTYDPGPAGG